MNRFKSPLTMIVFGISAICGSGVLVAQQPGWSPSIIATGEERTQIRATPIEQRPYRPLHFYGNTVRRNHYRSTVQPTLRQNGPLPARVISRR